MSTVIPKQTKKERDQITIRLDRDILQTLEQYCRYLESGRDYVVGQCLSFIFRKDRSFNEWLAAQTPDASSPSALPATANGASKQSTGPGKPAAIQRRLSVTE